MTGSGTETSWRAPATTWISPARARARYASVPTPHGEYTLFRGPGPQPDATAKAEARERWQLVLDEDVLFEVEDAAAPWHGLRTRMLDGVRGRLDGVPFTARATRSFLPRRRGIRFSLEGGRAFAFTVERGRRHLIRTTDDETRTVASSRRGRWETDHLDRLELALLCFVTVSGADALLSSPLREL